MANLASKLIKIAKDEVGYIEKKSNNYLEFKTKNAGSNNWTKYNKYFGFSNVYWCANFYSWLHAKAFGKDGAKKTLCGGTSAACETLRQQFIKADRYSKTPKVGDAVFFSGHRHSGANHVGLVYKVSSNHVYTIEGNASGGSSVTDNGGCVTYKQYALNYDRILGYGHPKYDKEVSTSTEKSSPKSDIAKPTLKKGMHGDGVKTLQKNLNAVMKSSLEVDGSFGAKTEEILALFKIKYKVGTDGSVYGKKSYSAMKKALK